MGNNRFWQNWDFGRTAELIDKYWVTYEKSWRTTLVNDISKKFAKKSNILEVGCGSGLIYEGMSLRKIVNRKTYIGGDISKKMLSIAKSRYPNVDFREMDILAINLNDSSVDNVINVHVIQHLPNYEEAIKELLRITKKHLYIVSWFVLEMGDEIYFSDPSENWDNQQFHNNNYSLPRFIQFLMKNSTKPISDVALHHFGDKNYSILISF